MHVMDWMEVRRWWRASVVEVCGSDGENGSARRASERERSERESENERAQRLRLPFLSLLARSAGSMSVRSHHTVRVAWRRSATVALLLLGFRPAMAD